MIGIGVDVVGRVGWGEMGPNLTRDRDRRTNR